MWALTCDAISVLKYVPLLLELLAWLFLAVGTRYFLNPVVSSPDVQGSRRDVLDLKGPHLSARIRQKNVA